FRFNGQLATATGRRDAPRARPRARRRSGNRLVHCDRSGRGAAGGGCVVAPAHPARRRRFFWSGRRQWLIRARRRILRSPRQQLFCPARRGRPGGFAPAAGACARGILWASGRLAPAPLTGARGWLLPPVALATAAVRTGYCRGLRWLLPPLALEGKPPGMWGNELMDGVGTPCARGVLLHCRRVRKQGG